MWEWFQNSEVVIKKMGVVEGKLVVVLKNGSGLSKSRSSNQMWAWFEKLEWLKVNYKWFKKSGTGLQNWSGLRKCRSGFKK